MEKNIKQKKEKDGDRKEERKTSVYQPQLLGVYVNTHKINFNHPAFADPKLQAKVIAALPTKPIQDIGFVLNGINCALANALRRVVTTELEVKALSVNKEEIKTNDKEIIKEQLVDNIILMKLDQDIPDDTVFSLTAKAGNIDEEYKNIYSRSLVQVSGKASNKRSFMDTYQLLKLQAERYIEVPNITVKRGRGFDHPMFIITSKFKYQTRDFVDIQMLNISGNLAKVRVNRYELISCIKSSGVSSIPSQLRDDHIGMINLSILVIPCKDYLNIADPKVIAGIKSFEIVLELDEATKLRTYSSTEVNPAEFFLEFTVYGNISPLELMLKACDDIIDRLKKVDSLGTDVISDTEKTRFYLKGEDHTIANMITRTVYELDPHVPLVNYTIKHPQLRSATINIKHSEPQKIYHDAITGLIATWEDIKHQFSTYNKKI